MRTFVLSHNKVCVTERNVKKHYEGGKGGGVKNRPKKRYVIVERPHTCIVLLWPRPIYSCIMDCCFWKSYGKFVVKLNIKCIISDQGCWA